MAKPQYGHAHRKRRAALLPKAIGSPCPLCGTTLTANNADFDHEIPTVLGGTRATRFLCRTCNRSRGAALGNRLRKRRTLPRYPSSGSM